MAATGAAGGFGYVVTTLGGKAFRILKTIRYLCNIKLKKMKFLNDYHRESTLRMLAKQKAWKESFMKLSPEERAKWAAEEAERAKARLAEANRLYPEGK
ncbi:MAG: hypothetical protein K2L16_03620 [Muribaculaceae bacterium]|nr:hypothetical protein [Muribaculaceae bacterium]